MTADQEPFIFSGTHFAEDLQQRVLDSLRLRLGGDSHYTVEEIQKVSQLKSSLFPKDFVLDEENTDRLRLLSILSQSALPGEEKIRSHRPYLGPVIVFLKRIFWRILKGHLHGSFEALEQFNSLMLYGHARQLVRLKHMEDAIRSGSALSRQID